LAQYLSSRFDCHFEERAWVEGKMVKFQDAGQGGNSATRNRFYFSKSFVVKAYMNVLGSDREKIFAEGLHEAAATAFVCHKRNWKCEVFGVSIEGITHICLLRTLLDSNPLNADEATDAFVELLRTTGVAHGDTHPENVLWGPSGVEVLDCERCFLIDQKLQDEMAGSIRSFAKYPLKRPELLSKFRDQGLEATRHRFILLAREIRSGARDIFRVGIDEFVGTFQNMK
jgi:hypothetical protein